MGVKKWRTTSALAAVVLQWVSVVSVLAGYFCLSAFSDGASGAFGIVGLVLMVVFLLAELAVLICALLAVARNRGRVRAGAIFLATIPVLLLILAAFLLQLTSTRDEIFSPLAIVYSSVALLVGTLLICLPEKLGTR